MQEYTPEVQAAIRWLREDVAKRAAGDGCNCPVCDRKAKWGRRSLSKKQARALINLYKHTQPGEFKHNTEFADNPGDGDEIAKCRYWGLVETGGTAAKEKIHTGHWRLTPHGRWFVQGKCTIIKYVWVYQSEARGWEGPQVSIYDCLKQKFDIREVLVPGPATYR